ncbi:hypothetical protein FOA52_000102 [Chlamydomonas sp. UWO 241]|nr:hypothetical protein FOA52_000102 [Chlamydomonas sp. UWO 241]
MGRVTDDLLSAFASALGVPREALPPVVYSRAQLWGAAVPLNSPQVPCILDPLARVAVAGDWVAGRNVQAGALSGLATARALAALRGVAPRDAAALGLRTPLVKLA